MISLIQRYVLYALSMLLVIALGACEFYYLRCERQSVKIHQLELNYNTALEANQQNARTVATLIIERTKSARTCESRLQGYNDTLAELQRIDNLRGVTYEIRNPQSEIRDVSPDPLLDALNGMFPDLRRAESGGKNGVCQTRHPANAESTTILSGSISYCFCSNEDVKNLLKNNALKNGHESDLITIIEGLR